MAARNKTRYWGMGSGVYVIPPDGIPIKVPGTISEKKDNAKIGEKYNKLSGVYEAGVNDVIMHIHQRDHKIFLAIGKRFNSHQQKSVTELGRQLGQDFPIEIYGVEPSIHFETDKFVQKYNLIALA